MEKFKEWPGVLQRRWILSALIGAGFLLVGLAMYFSLQDRVLLIISVLLAGCMVWRCISFYRMAAAGAYEVVEGVCITIGKSGLKKHRSVRLLTLDGNEYSVMLDKRTPLRIGNHYRVFFRREADAAGMPLFLQSHFSHNQFLALEDLGEYQFDADANETAEESEASGE